VWITGAVTTVKPPSTAATRNAVVAEKLAPAALAAVLAVAAVATPREMEFSRFLPVAPAFASALWPMRATLALGVVLLLGVGGYMAADRDGSHLYTAGALAAVTAAAAYASHMRLRRELALREVRAVADAAQAVLLRPLPRRVGTLAVDSAYRSAAPHAQVGGDFFALADTPYGIRIVLGDVRGKGLPALAVTAAVLGCFREAAYDAADLTRLADRLDAALARESDGDRYPAELFATAVLVQFPHEGDTAELISRGHPAPLLTTRAGTTALDPSPVPPVRFALRRGDRLLLYTDGVSESRGPAGAFFPLADWAGAHPAAGTAELLTALRGHSGGGPADDVAALVVRRDAAAPG
jgi:serine phosphatase RsbU (regulator of sigma subunit)